MQRRIRKNLKRYIETYRAPCGLRYAKDGHPKKPYILLTPVPYTYYSKRYKKSITLEPLMRSDGATGAFDIRSCGWWVHDQLCNKGRWDDGSRLTNWQCSMVLADILWDEGRYFRSFGWFVATFLRGGGEARKNGMFTLKEAMA